MASSWQVGDRVRVQGKTCEGIIRYVGETQFGDSGSWVGVELDAPEGRNDGSVEGVVYFECEPYHGVFARPEKIRSSNRRPSNSLITRGVGARTGAAVARSGAAHRGSGSSSGMSGSRNGSSSRMPIDLDADVAAAVDVSRAFNGVGGRRSSGGSSSSRSSPFVRPERSPRPLVRPPTPPRPRAHNDVDMDEDALLAAAIAASEREEDEREVQRHRREREELLEALRVSRADAAGSSADAAGAEAAAEAEREEDAIRQELATPRVGGRNADVDDSTAALMERQHAAAMEAMEAQARYTAMREQQRARNAAVAMLSEATAFGGGDSGGGEAMDTAPDWRGSAAGADGWLGGGRRFGAGADEADDDDDEEDDDDAMLQAALAMSRGEAVGGAGGVHAAAAGPSGFFPSDHALAALLNHHGGGFLPQLDGFGVPAPPPPPPLRPFAGIWRDTLLAISAEAMEMPHMQLGDKVMLPAATLQSLMALVPAQRMPHPMLFRISLARGGAEGPGKHVGVLEFSAPDGCIVVPLWVMRSLGISDSAQLLVETAELPRGTFAKLQPLSEDFAQLEDPKGTLEHAISGVYTTLTKGDSIVISHGNHELELFVVELQPADAVCVIETELEVDFAPAVINEEEQRRRAEQLALERHMREEEERVALKAMEEAAAAEAAAVAAAEIAARQAEAEAQTESRKTAREETVAMLPPEPDAAADVTTVLVRMPDGPRISRRFHKDTPLQVVRSWVEASSPPERPMRCFALVSNFPRVIVSAENSQLTLEAAGLHPQGTLFVKEEEG